MAPPTSRAEQFVPQSPDLDKVFEFFSKAKNLKRLALAWGTVSCTMWGTIVRHYDDRVMMTAL